MDTKIATCHRTDAELDAMRASFGTRSERCAIVRDGAPKDNRYPIRVTEIRNGVAERSRAVATEADALAWASDLGFTEVVRESYLA